MVEQQRSGEAKQELLFQEHQERTTTMSSQEKKDQRPETSSTENQVAQPETTTRKDTTMESTVIKEEHTGKGHKAQAMKVENLALSALVVSNNHPRKGLRKMDSLISSLRRDGIQEPLQVYPMGNSKYGIIDGTRRLQAAKDLGWESVPCIVTQVQEMEATHLAYVRNVERNALDPIEIALHIKKMKDDFGFTHQELELKGYGSSPNISNKISLLRLPGSVQEMIRKGDLKEAHGLELIKLPKASEQEKMAKQAKDFDLSAKKLGERVSQYLKKCEGGDSRPKIKTPSGDIPGVYIKDARDMSELPNKSVHMILSSPPYNVGMEFEKGVSFPEHLDNIRGVMTECSRVLMPGGVMVLNVGDLRGFKGRNGKDKNVQIELMGHYYQACLRKGQIHLTDVIIWKKPTVRRNRPNVVYTGDTKHGAYRILDNFEPIYVFRKTGEREVPQEPQVLNSRLSKEQWVAWSLGVWEISPVSKQAKHPCEWPVELPNRLIQMFSYEGDTVLDPFLGSGTTVKVANELGRNGIGYERDARYKAVIMDKLGVVEGQPRETMEEFRQRAIAEGVEDRTVEDSQEGKEEYNEWEELQAEIARNSEPLPSSEPLVQAEVQA